MPFYKKILSNYLDTNCNPVKTIAKIFLELLLIIFKFQLCFKANNYALNDICNMFQPEPMKVKENRFELQHSARHVGLPSSSYYVVILTESEL